MSFSGVHHTIADTTHAPPSSSSPGGWFSLTSGDHNDSEIVVADDDVSDDDDSSDENRARAPSHDHSEQLKSYPSRKIIEIRGLEIQNADPAFKSSKSVLISECVRDGETVEGTSNERAVRIFKRIVFTSVEICTADGTGTRSPQLKPMPLEARVVLTRRHKDGVLANIDVDVALPARILMVMPGAKAPLELTVRLRSRGAAVTASPAKPSILSGAATGGAGEADDARQEALTELEGRIRRMREECELLLGETGGGGGGGGTLVPSTAAADKHAAGLATATASATNSSGAASRSLASVGLRGENSEGAQLIETLRHAEQLITPFTTLRAQACISPFLFFTPLPATRIWCSVAQSVVRSSVLCSRSVHSLNGSRPPSGARTPTCSGGCSTRRCGVSIHELPPLPHAASPRSDERAR